MLRLRRQVPSSQVCRPRKKDAEGERAEDAAVRVRWRAEAAALPADDLVFLDETGSHLGYTPTHAWAPRGQRAHAAAPRNPGENKTVVAALTRDGIRALHAVRRRHDQRPLRGVRPPRPRADPASRARSSSPTTSAPTTPPAHGPPSRRGAPGSSSCRPTRRTSTPSSTPSPRSSSSSDAPGPAPTTPSAPPPGPPSPPSPRPTPPAGSPTAATPPDHQLLRRPL